MVVRPIVRPVTREVPRASAGSAAGAASGSLGPELLLNGSFATDTAWLKGLGWTIAAGVATYDGSGTTGISQDVALVVGGRYRVTFTITAVTSGQVYPRFIAGTAVDGTLRGALGTYTEDLVAVTGNLSLSLTGALFVGSIDNVSLRRVYSS